MFHSLVFGTCGLYNFLTKAVLIRNNSKCLTQKLFENTGKKINKQVTLL